MLKSIKGVEVFAEGTWNGDTYSTRDLEEMVKAFNETSKTLRPPLKLGHSDNQTLLQQDGLPAAGWIGSLYVKGKKLLADFVDIPNKIYDLLEKGGYKKVSSEIYWNMDLAGNVYPRFLGAVSLLGADMPAVSTLSDILSLYTVEDGQKRKPYEFDGSSLSIKPYTFNSKNYRIEESQRMPTEKELQLEAELKLAKEKLLEAEKLEKQYKIDLTAKDSELEKHAQFKKEAEAKALATARELASEKLNREIEGLQSEKLVTPAMKEYVREFLSEDKKEYSVKLKDKDEKKFTKVALFKEILKLHAAGSSVNLDEDSEAGRVENKNKEDELDVKINQYAKEHKVSYAQAYKTIMSDSE